MEEKTKQRLKEMMHSAERKRTVKRDVEMGEEKNWVCLEIMTVVITPF